MTTPALSFPSKATLAPPPAESARKSEILGEFACAGVRLTGAPALLIADVATNHKTLGVDVPPSILAGAVGGLVAGMCAAFGVSPRYGLAVCESAAQAWMIKGVLKLASGGGTATAEEPIRVKEKKAA